MSHIASCLILIFIVACSIKPTSAAVSDISNIDYLIEGNFLHLDIDKLGNIYLLNSENELSKYNSDYDLLFTYSSKRFGEITSFDVTNPQKILVYLQSYQFVVFLDNTMSEIKTLSLDDLNYWNTEAVGLSVDNHIWLYDRDQYRIIKIEDTGDVLLSSNELYDEMLGSENVLQIQERHNLVYVSTARGVMVFNDFGQFLHNITDIQSGKVVILDNAIAYKDGKLVKLNKLTPNVMEDSISVDCRNLFRDFAFDGDVLFLIDNTGLFRCSID